MSEKITLLYVDDEPTNLLLFELNFNKVFDILIADSGLEGLQILRENPHIKAVISDMRMPEMNGIEFIKASKEEFSEISYFILTGYEIDEEIFEALNQGLIKKLFKKPFNKKVIEEAIKKSLN